MIAASNNLERSDGSAVHFISGLPRSGSTLLSTLLNQNPRFSASVTSPVAMLWGGLLSQMSAKTEFGTFFDEHRRQTILTSVLSAYHHHNEVAHVVFDTNRAWTSRLALIAKLFPNARVVCCVRSIPWILDSIESMLRRNPTLTSRALNFSSNGHVYSRAETLMNSDKGLVGSAWSSLREAWFGPDAHRLIIVDYDKLVRDPGAMLSGLYQSLGEHEFQHVFEDLSFNTPEYDADLGMPGLHYVRSKVAPVQRRIALPPDLVSKYAEADFWARPSMNQGNAAIL